MQANNYNLATHQTNKKTNKTTYKHVYIDNKKITKNYPVIIIVNSLH